MWTPSRLLTISLTAGAFLLVAALLFPSVIWQGIAAIFTVKFTCEVGLDKLNSVSEPTEKHERLYRRLLWLRRWGWLIACLLLTGVRAAYR